MVTQAKVNMLKILKKASKDNDAPIWAKVADYVQKSRSNQKIVNLTKINQTTEDGNENDKIMLTLDSGFSDETRTILSGELKSQDDSVVPTSNDIPIVTLAPGQSIKFEAYARLGKGTEHARWNSANIVTLTDTEKDDEKVLTVESTGALNPKHIILSSVEQLSSKLSEFKTIISEIK